MGCCLDPGSQISFHTFFFLYRLEHSAAVQVTPIPSLALAFACSVRQRWLPLLSLLLVTLESSRKSPDFPNEGTENYFYRVHHSCHT